MLYNKCHVMLYNMQGRIQNFFLGGGALVSSSTSTPITHIVFFFCRIPVVLEHCRSSYVGGCAPPAPSPQFRPRHVSCYVI